jgi:hypothetical protein
VRLLVIRWDGEAQTWRVVDMDTREVVESFVHILDAAWFVQSNERAA